MDSYTAVFRTDSGSEWAHVEKPQPLHGDYPWQTRDRTASALLHVIAGAVGAGATLVRIELPADEAVA